LQALDQALGIPVIEFLQHVVGQLQTMNGAAQCSLNYGE
jgi:hypothetical protein